jgi:hypothetical protein
MPCRLLNDKGKKKFSKRRHQGAFLYGSCHIWRGGNKTYEEPNMYKTTISTNDKSLDQLIEIARTLGISVYPSKRQPLCIQRDRVMTELERNGVRIVNTSATYRELSE